MPTQIHKRPLRRAGARRAADADPTEARKSITVDGSPEECYRLWRDVSNLPRFLSFVESIEATGERWTHWVGKEGDERIGWDAELIRDDRAQALEWESVGKGVDITRVSVRFEPAPGDRGTIVRLTLKRGTKPERVRADRELHRFKMWKETGEIATTEGQPAGRRGPLGKLLRKGEQ